MKVDLDSLVSQMGDPKSFEKMMKCPREQVVLFAWYRVFYQEYLKTLEEDESDPPSEEPQTPVEAPTPTSDTDLSVSQIFFDGKNHI